MHITRGKAGLGSLLTVCVLAIGACAPDAESAQPSSTAAKPSVSNAPVVGGSIATGAAGSQGSTSAGGRGAVVKSAGGSTAPVVPPSAPAVVGGSPAATPPSAPASASPAPSQPVVAPNPVAGDPNGTGAVVTIADAPCGPAMGLDAFVQGTGIPGPGSPNVKIGGRDVVLSYPCNLKEGAHVTFFLNLHGTMPDESLKTYQHGYFSAHKLVTSHNLIVVTPISKSPVGQWGNMDGNVDVPHLYEVVQWVYDKFSKFQIVSMWVGGHSWGSMFAKQFVCDAMFKDKVRGVVGMSGGATGAAGCGDRISQIHTVGDAEGGESGVPDQTAVATAHGCDNRLAPNDLGNGQMLYEWPNCDKGWVHFNFVMGKHEHTTPIDAPVVLHIVNAIKSTEH